MLMEIADKRCYLVKGSIIPEVGREENTKRSMLIGIDHPAVADLNKAGSEIVKFFGCLKRLGKKKALY